MASALPKVIPYLAASLRELATIVAPIAVRIDCFVLVVLYIVTPNQILPLAKSEHFRITVFRSIPIFCSTTRFLILLIRDFLNISKRANKPLVWDRRQL